MNGASKSAADINLKSQDIRRQLSGTKLSKSPTDVAMPPGSSRWPEPMREQLSGHLKPAGVLVPVIERGTELSILLTQRAAELKHHAGQVSFPGGRMEDHDDNVEATALRETHEEVGIAPHDVSVVGYLRAMPTITGYAVTPVVGLISGDTELAIDRSEVEYTFEVPLHFFLNTANDIRKMREFHGREVPMIEFSWEGERIWGATAYILLEFRKILLNK